MQITVIQDKIFEIREKKVMLDLHLAELYEVETKHLKQAVKRNLNRFPSDFMFEQTDKELRNLRSLMRQYVSKKSTTKTLSRSLQLSNYYWKKEKRTNRKLKISKTVPA